MTADQIKAVLSRLNNEGAATLISWLTDAHADSLLRPVLADFAAWVAQRPQYLRQEEQE